MISREPWYRLLSKNQIGIYTFWPNYEVDRANKYLLDKIEAMEEVLQIANRLELYQNSFFKELHQWKIRWVILESKATILTRALRMTNKVCWIDATYHLLKTGRVCRVSAHIPKSHFFGFFLAFEDLGVFLICLPSLCLWSFEIYTAPNSKYDSCFLS